MVNLSRIDKNVYKSLGFKNKSIGQTMIKKRFTKVTNFKTIPALVQHIKPKWVLTSMTRRCINNSKV
jgi:hypothetical protein